MILIVVCSGGQHEFCKAHVGVWGPEATTAVCGPHWPASLLPWQVVPAVVANVSQVQLLAYKPGAGQLPAWWTTPHR